MDPNIPKKIVKGVLNLRVLKSNGVEILKEALTKSFSMPSDTDVGILYLGSGKYQLKASGYDFKVAERAMNSVANNIVEFIDSKGGTASFKRED